MIQIKVAYVAEIVQSKAREMTIFHYVVQKENSTGIAYWGQVLSEQRAMERDYTVSLLLRGRIRRGRVTAVSDCSIGSRCRSSLRAVVSFNKNSPPTPSPVRKPPLLAPCFSLSENCVSQTVKVTTLLGKLQS